MNEEEFEIFFNQLRNQPELYIQYLNDYIKQNPNEYIMLTERAKTKMLINDFEGALEDLNLFNKKIPNHPTYYVEMGWMFLNQNQYPKALDFFNTSIELATQNDIDDLSYYYGKRANCFSCIGDYAQAYQDLLMLSPFYFEFAETLHQYSEILEKYLRLYEEAICAMRLAHEKNPTSIDYLWRIAVLYENWNTKQFDIDLEFIKLIGIDKREKINSFISEQCFNDKTILATNFYTKAFYYGISAFRTDLKAIPEKFALTLFVPNTDYLLNTLTDEAIYFSSPSKFTDLTDCPLVREENHSNSVCNLVFNYIRIRCLCEDDNVLKQYKMWADYASGHKGIAIKLEFTKEWLIQNNIYLRKVEYFDEYSKVNMKYDSPESVILSGLYFKHADHKFEKEVRLLKFDETNPTGIKVPWLLKGRESASVKVQSVYIGINTDATVKEKIFILSAKMNFDVYKLKLGTSMNIEIGEL